MGWVGSILFAVMFLWYIISQKFAHRKRLNLRSYIVFLLMDHEIWNEHSSKFKDWIKNSKATTAQELSLRAHNIIENMADDFAEKGFSVLTAHALLWNSDAAINLRSKMRN
jgi:hypothetical protein